ncbi:MAG: cell division ATP-binding protein FtsE [Chitinivibrionales bacterium]|nr:cell division ATP-binding protein FtsE [Chitinivibrionales bacterium]MBD3393994.1 cell division ATP-binding protein FtsE [Chitinivibrionales bacterium]
MIQFSHVSKTYDNQFEALNDIDLFIDKAEFVLLTGESGAGKTTLLKHIYMEEIPSVGQVFVCGYESKYVRRKDIPRLRRKLGIVFQDFRLLYDRNVFENVAFAMRVTGVRERIVKRKVWEVLAHTGLSHKSSFLPSQLSGGEQQRVCIARAIINSPLVLLADEPTGNLDTAVSLEIFSLLQEINSWGTTVVVATHDDHLIKRYHYRQLVLHGGVLVKGGNQSIKPKTWKEPQWSL